MECSPFDDESQGPRGKRAIQEADRLDSDLRFRASVGGVEVRWIVIQKVHPYDDAEEPRDFWHVESWSG